MNDTLEFLVNAEYERALSVLRRRLKDREHDEQQDLIKRQIGVALILTSQFSAAFAQLKELVETAQPVCARDLILQGAAAWYEGQQARAAQCWHSACKAPHAAINGFDGELALYFAALLGNAAQLDSVKGSLLKKLSKVINANQPGAILSRFVLDEISEEELFTLLRQPKVFIKKRIVLNEMRAFFYSACKSHERGEIDAYWKKIDATANIEGLNGIEAEWVLARCEMMFGKKI